MFLIFDIGASWMRLAISADGQDFDEPKIIATPGDPGRLADEFFKAAQALIGGRELTAVAGGLTRKRIAARDALRRLFHCPIYLENDTALVGLGEAVKGAGQGVSILAYVTISTGVGGVRIIDGRIDRCAIGFEPGHQIINFDGEPKTWEDLISGAAVQKLTGKHPAKITDPQFWENLAQPVAYGLYNTILHWSPEVVVLGGGMMGTPGIALTAVERHLKTILTIFPDLPPLKKAVLGDQGGLFGALVYLRQKLSQKR